MDAAEGMKKAIAEQKTNLAKSLKVLDAAVKESQANRQARTAEQHRSE